MQQPDLLDSDYISLLQQPITLQQKKKNKYLTSVNRLLKADDLATNLVYEKRSIKNTINFYQQPISIIIVAIVFSIIYTTTFTVQYWYQCQCVIWTSYYEIPKPQQLYSIIDMMFKRQRKLQIFARNHNRRFGLFSIGNQLGESYEKWLQTTSCDKCIKPIQIGQKRYKSKVRQNYDLCNECVGENKEDFFNQLMIIFLVTIANPNLFGETDFIAKHAMCLIFAKVALIKIYQMNKNLLNEQKIHPKDHKFNVLEIPIFGNDFPIHEHKCYSCYQNPIVGICYSCTSCRSFKLCQKCFFERPKYQTIYNSKNHREQHQLQAIFQPQYATDKKYECLSSKKQITQQCHMCQNCYNFFSAILLSKQKQIQNSLRKLTQKLSCLCQIILMIIQKYLQQNS